MIVLFTILCFLSVYILVKLFRAVKAISKIYQQNKRKTPGPVDDPESKNDLDGLLYQRLAILENELDGIKERTVYKTDPGEWTSLALSSGYDLELLQATTEENELVKIGYKTPGITYPEKIPLTEKEIKRKAVLLGQIYTLKKKLEKKG